MASEITAATLTLTITEAITLDGEARGGSVQQTIASVTEYSKRIVEVPITEINLLSFGTAAGAGTYVNSTVKYIRQHIEKIRNGIVYCYPD